VSSPEAPSNSLVPAALAASTTPDAADPAVVDLPSLHHAEIATVRRYADASRAASTQRAYASDWRRPGREQRLHPALELAPAWLAETPPVVSRHDVASLMPFVSCSAR